MVRMIEVLVILFVGFVDWFRVLIVVGGLVARLWIWFIVYVSLQLIVACLLFVLLIVLFVWLGGDYAVACGVVLCVLILLSMFIWFVVCLVTFCGFGVV